MSDPFDEYTRLPRPWRAPPPTAMMDARQARTNAEAEALVDTLMSVKSFRDRPELLLDAWSKGRGATREFRTVEDTARGILEQRVVSGYYATSRR